MWEESNKLLIETPFLMHILTPLEGWLLGEGSGRPQTEGSESVCVMLSFSYFLLNTSCPGGDQMEESGFR